jgi:hypothetical protein
MPSGYVDHPRHFDQFKHRRLTMSANESPPLRRVSERRRQQRHDPYDRPAQSVRSDSTA